MEKDILKTVNCLAISKIVMLFLGFSKDFKRSPGLATVRFSHIEMKQVKPSEVTDLPRGLETVNADSEKPCSGHILHLGFIGTQENLVICCLLVVRSQ